jgi:hypothetical protein
MAALSDATAIIEAGETSGTLHQAAMRAPRPLVVHCAVRHERCTAHVAAAVPRVEMRPYAGDH